MNRKLLLMPDGASSAGGETPEQKIARLEAENASLRAAQEQRQELGAEIREKMASGLSREQAEQVVKDQRQHDDYVAKRQGERKEAAQAAAKGGKR